MTARAWAICVLVLLVAAACAVAFVACEGGAPTIRAPDELVVGRAGRSVEIEVTDEGTGLRAVEAKLVHAQGEAELLSRRFSGSALPFGPPRPERERLKIALETERLEVPEGSAFLEITVRDGSWRRRFRGNEASARIPVTVDRRPPRVSLESGLTYVQHGGAGVLVYSVSEATERDGVEVGDAFFPGFALPGEGSGRRAALFAVPVEGPPDPTVRLVAVDRAGNQGSARPAVRIQEQSFPQSNVRLSEDFLKGKVLELAARERIDASDPVEAFRVINTELRSRNEARIRELVGKSAPRPLFAGPFEQLRNSKVTSRFAERRRYTADGQPVSQAIHYGFDLAATAGVPIAAANAGRVVHAGELGIYGECVILDHGLGLASLYGHLSQIDVAHGEEVAKGQTLGRSGETGLAGGDHLHFAVLVAGVYVNPLEWWDEKWVREHVTVRLGATPP